MTDEMFVLLKKQFLLMTLMILHVQRKRFLFLTFLVFIKDFPEVIYSQGVLGRDYLEVFNFLEHRGGRSLYLPQPNSSRI